MVKVTEDALLSNLFEEWPKLIQKTPKEKQYINVNVIYSWAHIGQVDPYPSSSRLSSRIVNKVQSQS